MKAFGLLILLPALAVADRPPYGRPPAPSYGSYPQPQPSYPPPKPQYGGYQPQPSYPPPKPQYGGYEEPKHNCSVEDVTEIAEVCVPSVASNCETVEIPIKRIVIGQYCYESSSTTCTETEETVDNEVCTYNYEKKYEDATAQTVEVNFRKETNVQMVTVCQPHHGYGYQSYGQQYCKEVAQETSYNIPEVSPKDVPVRVGYPEARKTCVNKPITIPRINCETSTEQKCVDQPEIEESTETLEKCTTNLGQNECQRIELTLPKQVCKEIVYGYAEDKKPKPQPSYPPRPQYPPPTQAPKYPPPPPKPTNQYPPPPAPKTTSRYPPPPKSTSRYPPPPPAPAPSRYPPPPHSA